MSVQTTYTFSTPLGGAGKIYDIAPYAIDTFMNEEATGTMQYGLGVVRGTSKKSQCKLPTSSATAADFIGVTSNNGVTEFDTEGVLHLRKGLPIGVMKYGAIFVRIKPTISEGVTTYENIAAGDAVYMINTGTYAGYFTKTASTNVAVKARFLGPVDTTLGIAAVELFNQAQA